MSYHLLKEAINYSFRGSQNGLSLEQIILFVNVSRETAKNTLARMSNK